MFKANLKVTFKTYNISYFYLSQIDSLCMSVYDDMKYSRIQCSIFLLTINIKSYIPVPSPVKGENLCRNKILRWISKNILSSYTAEYHIDLIFVYIWYSFLI